MDGVGLDVAAAANEINLDDDQVVNVLEVITDSLLGLIGMASSDDHVSCGTCGDLVGNVGGEKVVSVSPSDEDLHRTSQPLASH